MHKIIVAANKKFISEARVCPVQSTPGPSHVARATEKMIAQLKPDRILFPHPQPEEMKKWRANMRGKVMGRPAPVRLACPSPDRS